MEQPIKKNKFSYFARSRLRLRPHEIKAGVFAFDKGERLHSAVAFENFGAFIDTDLAPPPKEFHRGEIIQGK